MLIRWFSARQNLVSEAIRKVLARQKQTLLVGRATVATERLGFKHPNAVTKATTPSRVGVANSVPRQCLEPGMRWRAWPISRIIKNREGILPTGCANEVKKRSFAASATFRWWGVSPTEVFQDRCGRFLAPVRQITLFATSQLRLKGPVLLRENVARTSSARTDASLRERNVLSSPTGKVLARVRIIPTKDAGCVTSTF